VPEPLALNLHVFLDDVLEFNGPLTFIPGSHHQGPAPAALDTATTSYPLWVVDRSTGTATAVLLDATGGGIGRDGAEEQTPISIRLQARTEPSPPRNTPALFIP